MQGQEVTITDMMFCRDRRVQIQNEFIEKYQKPVISFCMNIPGPIKTTPLIRKGFEAGKMLYCMLFLRQIWRYLNLVFFMILQEMRCCSVLMLLPKKLRISLSRLR